MGYPVALPDPITPATRGLLGLAGLATTGITGDLTLTKTGTTARTATFPDAAIEVQAASEARGSGNFTARLGGVYAITATATVTDPTPAEGRGFESLVRNGTATIGGTAYATAGAYVRRTYHSGAWGNYVYPHLDAAWTWTQAQTFSATARFNAAEAIGLGVAPTAGNGLLQLASGTTKANGIALGTDCFIYRSGAVALRFDVNEAKIVRSGVTEFRVWEWASGTYYMGPMTAQNFALRTNDADRIVIDTNGNTAHLFAIADRSLVLYTPASGTTQTIANNVSTAIIQGTLASLTVQMPAAPVDGQIVRVIFNATITTLTISANAGQALASGSPTSSALGATVSYIYRASGATWYILGKNA